MEVKQQLEDVGQQLQQAVLQAAMPEDDEPFNVDEWRKEALARKNGAAGQADSGDAKNAAEMREQPPSPINGARLPAGRPKGVQNRVTRTIREAVEKAARECHADGLAGWLVERAQGSLGDRQIFAQMVNKAMPLQVQAQVGGGVQIQLSWLGQRQIGTTVAQQAEQRTQVLDLQAEKDGTYRIIDPVTPAEGGQAAAKATDEKPVGGADAP